MHMMRNDDPNFDKFGEIYFSYTHPNTVKAWHMHKKMTLNYAVISGVLKVVLFDNRRKSPTFGRIQEIFLSPENYCLLKISPGLWFGFQGIGDNKNVILNIADIEHDPLEQQRAPIEYLSYDWKSSEETSL